MPDIGCVLMYGGEGDQTDPVRNPVEDHQCIAFGCPDPDGTLLGGGGLVRILHRRTLLVPVGAEHAAIAALRFHGDTTRATLVEVDAVVGGHRLRRIVVTGRARDRRNKLSHSLGSSLPYQLPSLAARGESHRIRSIARSDHAYSTDAHGHGQTTATSQADVDVGRRTRSASQRRAPVLHATESHSRESGFRRVRRVALSAILRG